MLAKTVKMMKAFFGFALCVISVLVTPGLSEDKMPSPQYLFKLLDEHRYEEFQRYTHIRIPESSEMPGSRVDRYRRGSDILMSTEQYEQSRQGIRFENHPMYRWEGTPAKVPYIVDVNYPEDERKIVDEAIAEWNAKNPCVQFTPLQEEETNGSYVMFYHGEYCGAYLGRHDYPQEIFTTDGCDTKGDLLHGMEHTIGMLHEHSRPDRDEYVEVLYENIFWFFRPDYYKGSNESFNSLLDYDYYSLMHYPYLAPFSDKPAFKILQDGVDKDKMGLNEDFTDLDIKKIAALYC